MGQWGSDSPESSPIQLSTGRSPDRFQDMMPIATNSPIQAPVRPRKPRCDDTRTKVPNIILTTLKRIIDNRRRNRHIPKVSIIADSIIESLFNVPIPPPTPPPYSHTPSNRPRHRPPTGQEPPKTQGQTIGRTCNNVRSHRLYHDDTR